MDRREIVPRRVDSGRAGNDRDRGPRPIGEVLAELLAHYEQRFPGVGCRRADSGRGCLFVLKRPAAASVLSVVD